MCDQIEPSVYKNIVEGIVGRLEGELKKPQSMPKEIKDIREKCLKELLEIAKLLTNHAYRKTGKLYEGVTNLDKHLFTLEQDTEEHWCLYTSRPICPGLSEVSRHLRSVNDALESRPDNELQTEQCSSSREDLWTVVRPLLPMATEWEVAL